MERRSYLRLPLHLMTLVHGGKVVPQFCKTTNIGPSGGCLKVKGQYLPGTNFIVDIYADMTRDAHRTLSIPATTIYQDSQLLGIKFPSVIDFYLLVRSASSIAANKKYPQNAPNQQEETGYGVTHTAETIAV